MAFRQALPAVNLSAGHSGTLDPTQFSRTGTANTNTQLFEVYLAQARNQSLSNILLGSNENLNSSIFDNAASSGVPSNTSALFGGSSAASLPSELTGLTGQLTNYANTPRYLELIARSNLVGKTVTYFNSANLRETREGVVDSVAIENGVLKIMINGNSISPEFLKSVKS